MSLASTDQRLMQALAAELKLPLLQIARRAELADPSALEQIGLSAEQALWFIDSYLLNQQLQQQATLELEPVTVAAVLDDVAHRLDRLAKQYGCHLELQLSGRYQPVMAHRPALEAALSTVGVSLVTAAAEATSETRPDPTERRLVLAGHKSRGGIVAGIYSSAEGLSQSVLRRGQNLYGQASQSMPEFSAQSGAGVYLASQLFNAMQARLRVARHHQLTGLAATMAPSRQLALV